MPTRSTLAVAASLRRASFLRIRNVLFGALQDISRKLWILDYPRHRQGSDQQGDGRERLASCSFRTGFVELAGNKINEIQIPPRRSGTCRFIGPHKLAAKRSQYAPIRSVVAMPWRKVILGDCLQATLGRRALKSRSHALREGGGT